MPMFQCEGLKKANPLTTSSDVSSFSLPTTPLPQSLPSHCHWRQLHIFGFDDCLPPCPLSNFPKGDFQSLTWRDGKCFAKEREKKNGGFVQKDKLQHNLRHYLKWSKAKPRVSTSSEKASVKTGTWTEVSGMVSVAMSQGWFGAGRWVEPSSLHEGSKVPGDGQVCSPIAHQPLAPAIVWVLFKA